MLCILSGYATKYLFPVLYLISVSMCDGLARLASRQGWGEFSPSVKSSGFHQALSELWCFLRYSPENIDPQATLLSLAVTVEPLQGTACLFVCLVHRVHSAWVVFARSLEPSWVAERTEDWLGPLWRRKGTAAWRIPHCSPLIYCSSPRVCSQSGSIRKILVANGGPP